MTTLLIGVAPTEGLWDSGLTVTRRLVETFDWSVDPLKVYDVRESHLRGANGDEEDPYIRTLIKTSLRYAERRMQRAILPQTWALDLSGFPLDRIELPYPPVIGIESIDYYDGTGAQQTLDADVYGVSLPFGPTAQQAVIRLADGQAWPTPATRRDAVSVVYRAGYVTGGSPEQVAVPEDITHARLLIIGELYEKRNTSATWDAANAILDGYRAY